MLVILGGTYIFRPRSSPAWICDRCSLKILDSQWFLVRTRERYSLLRRSLKPQKSTFWNFLEFCRWKVWFQQGSTPAEAQQPFFFFSLSLYDFSRNDGILDRFEKEFIHHLVSWFLFWSCPRSICYVSISAPRLSLGWHPFCLSDLVLNNLWGFQCVNKCASTAVEAALTRKSTTIQPQTGKTPPLKAHDFVWSRSVTHFSALFV